MFCDLLKSNEITTRRFKFMKKISVLLTGILLSIGLAGCGNAGTGTATQSPEAESTAAAAST